MGQRKLTIDLPQSADVLHNLLQTLLQYGLISERKARTIEQETTKETKEKGRWALVAEEMSKQGYLKGRGEELIESIREFRDDFEISDPFGKA